MIELNFVIGETYTENDIFEILRSQNSGISEQRLKWILFEMIKKKQISQIGIKKYIFGGRTYSVEYTSQASKTISEFLSLKFPLAKCVTWEIGQLNEWINFLIAKNLIFVEIEPSLVNLIFAELQSRFGSDYLILLNPSDDEISRYMRDDLVVVKTLYSKSPMNKNSTHIKLEKLIVDVVVDKTFSNLLDTEAVNEIVGGIFKNYDINIEKMYVYANRRRCKDKLTKIIEETNYSM